MCVYRGRSTGTTGRRIRGRWASVVVAGSSSMTWPTFSSWRGCRRCCCKFPLLCCGCGSPTCCIDDQQSTGKRALDHFTMWFQLAHWEIPVIAVGLNQYQSTTISHRNFQTIVHMISIKTPKHMNLRGRNWFKKYRHEQNDYEQICMVHSNI